MKVTGVTSSTLSAQSKKHKEIFQSGQKDQRANCDDKFPGGFPVSKHSLNMYPFANRRRIKPTQFTRIKNQFTPVGCDPIRDAADSGKRRGTRKIRIHADLRLLQTLHWAPATRECYSRSYGRFMYKMISDFLIQISASHEKLTPFGFQGIVYISTNSQKMRKCWRWLTKHLELYHTICFQRQTNTKLFYCPRINRILNTNTKKLYYCFIKLRIHE